LSKKLSSEYKAGTHNKRVLDAGLYFPDKSNKEYIRRSIEIPYVVIRGAHAGPTLCIVAGEHPTEYAGITAAIKLSNDINPKDLKGTLIIVPIANILAFWERKYISSLDGVNIMDTYPGDPKGSATQMIAHKIFNNLILKSDFYISLHGSDTHESMMGRSTFYLTGNKKIDKNSEGIARALGYRNIVCFDVRNGSKTGSSIKAAPFAGIPSAINEHGEGDRLFEKETERQFKGIISAMKYLGMLKGKKITTAGQRILSPRMIKVSSRGLFYAKTDVGSELAKGDIIGEVRDLDGKLLETVKAPAKGIVLSMIHNPVVEAGQIIILDYGIL